MNGIAKANKYLLNITTLVENQDKLVTAMKDLVPKVVTVVDKALETLEEPNSKEIKHTFEVRIVRIDLVLVIETACVILDRISEDLDLRKGDSMKAAKNGLKFSPPDMKLLQD